MIYSGESMAQPLVIAFGYKARRGKDAAVQHIIANRSLGPGRIVRYAFGDLLKEEVNVAAKAAGGFLGLFTLLATKGALLPDGSFIRIPDWVKYDPQPDMTDPKCPDGKHRTLLQWWGTEYRRNHDSFYWVKAVRDRIRAEQPGIALIADMRFQNEMMWAKSCKGFTVKVERLGMAEIGTNSIHSSEHELDGVMFDYEIIVQDGQLEILLEDALTVFDMIIERTFVDREIEQQQSVLVVEAA